MYWGHVVYRSIFISSLDSHSDGTYSLQMILWWASDAINKLSTSLMACGWAHFQFWVNYPFFKVTFLHSWESRPAPHSNVQPVDILVVQKWIKSAAPTVSHTLHWLPPATQTSSWSAGGLVQFK